MFSNSFSHRKADTKIKSLDFTFLFCSTKGEAVKKINGRIIMTLGHELHVHRYAKQSRARNL